MKLRHTLFQNPYQVIASLLFILVPAAIWIALSAPSFAASDPNASEHSLVRLNQVATRVPSPTPGPTRTVGWGNTKLPGFTGGLPPTSMYADKGAGPLHDIFCSRVAVPSELHYWVPGYESLKTWGNATLLYTSDLARPPTLAIDECGGDAAEETVYEITGPERFAATITTNADEFIYDLPTGSPTGEYKVTIYSSHGTSSLDFIVVNRPELFVHDVLTEEPNPDPTHEIRVDYVNFEPNSRVTVGLYRFITPDLDDFSVDNVGLVDQWSVDVDTQGRYSEILPPPAEQKPGDFLFMVACAVENCSSRDWDLEPFVPLAVRSMGFFPSPASDSPERAVMHFFDSVFTREYGISWAMLSGDLKSRLSSRPDGSPDFAKFVAGWDTLQSVTVDSVETLDEFPTTATVAAEFTFRLKEDLTEVKDRAQVELFWDDNMGIWRLSDLATSSFSFSEARAQPGAIECSEESGLSSIDAQVATSILFRNLSPNPVNIYWLNYSGDRELYVPELLPNASITLDTYLTHPWVVTDPADNCLGIYLPTDPPGVINVQ